VRAWVKLRFEEAVFGGRLALALDGWLVESVFFGLSSVQGALLKHLSRLLFSSASSLRDGG
jgi:hypothetical protein